MISFLQFIAEELVFHGTSSKFSPDILKHGLVPANRKNPKNPARVYVAHHSASARDEADRTVNGDDMTSGKKRSGVGGEPHVLVIDKDHPSLKNHKWKPDSEYGSGIASHTDKHIPPEAIKKVLKGHRSISMYTRKHKSYSPTWP